jgi:hypothetical protein
LVEGSQASLARPSDASVAGAVRNSDMRQGGGILIFSICVEMRNMEANNLVTFTARGLILII